MKRIGLQTLTNDRRETRRGQRRTAAHGLMLRRATRLARRAPVSTGSARELTLAQSRQAPQDGAAPRGARPARPPRRGGGRLYYPAQLAAAYVVVAGLWIVFSDAWAARLFRDPAQLRWVSSVKGLLFVVLTAALLFALARRLVRQVERAVRAAEAISHDHARQRRLIAELLDNSPDAIFAKDRDGRYTFVNREVARVTGRSAAHIVGADDRAIFPAEQAAQIAANDRAVMEGDGVLRTTERLSTADGDVTYLVTKGPLHGDDGSVNGMFGISRDITERERDKQQLADALESLRESQEIAGIGSYVLDIDSGRWQSSPMLDRLFGIDAAYERSVDGWAQLIDAADRDAMARYFAHEVLARRGAFDRQYRIVRRSDGRQRWVHGLGRIELDADGRPRRLRGTIQDITDRVRDDENLRIAAIAFEAQDGIIVADAQARIQRVNQAFSRITGYAPHEVVGHTPALLQSGRHDATFYAAMRDAVARDGYWQGELCSRRKDGTLFTERLAISAVKSRDGELTHYVASLADVTEQREAESRAQQLAYYDPLTGLPNRVLLHDRIEHALSWSGRSGEHCALLFVDLDNFKKINDTTGHPTGDALLVRAAQRMKGAVRDGDTVARFGGDEFIVVLEELGSDPTVAAMRAAQVAEKLRLSMAEPYDIDGQPFYCTASLGATLFVGGADTAEAILMHADLAMYRAKQDGRNALRFFEQGMQVELARRTALESELRQAIELGQFELYYQPQLDRAGAVVGAEALLRWHHPVRGLLAPGEFIAVAEETGLIVELGQWVLDAACARIAAWSERPATRERVLAVNVSARQFAHAGFVDGVLRAVDAAGADAARLKLELTESIVLDDVDDALRKMQALKLAGISFALDDFGTGSSSLSYLTRLPIDQLKIDKSFVDGLPDGRQDALVAQTIITMAQALGLAVVAEGVETDAQWRFLMRHGCELFQGFRFSAPVPVERFEAIAEAHGATPQARFTAEA
jgi:diguanylate cyclase (GGDEF)-like protein/PAS domain S-box-containing protein